MIRRIIIGVIQAEVGLTILFAGAIVLYPHDVAWMNDMAVPTFAAYIVIAILAARSVGKWIERRWQGETQ